MPNHSPRIIVLWASLACYWLGLFVATHVPAEFVNLSAQVSDKLSHVAAYAGLAVLLAAALHVTAERLNLRKLGTALALLALYGIVDESTQIPVGRDASIGDWLADLLGAAAGLGIFLALSWALAARDRRANSGS
jgi:VanZ family protein